VTLAPPRYGPGYAAALISPVCLAIGPIIIDDALRQGVTVPALLAVSAAVAAAATWGLALADRRPRPAAGSHPRSHMLLLAGVMGIVVAPAAGFFAIDRLGTTIVVCVFWLHVPAVSLLLTRVYETAPSRTVLASIVVCVAGVALVSLTSSTADVRLDVTGLSLALVSMTGMSAMAVLVQRAGARLDPIRFNAEALTIAAVVFAAVLVIGGDWRKLDAPSLLSGTLVAVLAIAPGRLLWSIAVRDVGARLAGILGSTQPALVAIFGVPLLQAELTRLQIVGVATLTIGVLLTHAGRPPGGGRG
jgi:drug/metabolite transporter (DMT)-like permease